MSPSDVRKSGNWWAREEYNMVAISKACRHKQPLRRLLSIKRFSGSSQTRPGDARHPPGVPEASTHGTEAALGHVGCPPSHGENRGSSPLGAPIKSRTCIEHCNPTSALLQFFSNFNGGTRGTDLLLIPRAPGFLVRSEALPSEGRCRRFESSRACQLFQ